MRYAAISLHFDSLGHAYGFPEGYRDPTFFEVSERFLNLAKKYDFKYSIYIIGKDLEKSENRERLKEWALQGHEIGNHSWSHPENLGALDEGTIRREVKAAHEIISDTVNSKPRGFASPAWAASSKLEKVLIDLNYCYDSSGFPSWILLPGLVKLLFGNLNNREMFKIFHRKDYFYWLFGPRRPYNTNGNLFKPCDSTSGRRIAMLPMPTNKYRIACWQTLAFMLGWRIYEEILKSCLKEEFFYLVLHPADLMNEEDLSPDLRAKVNMARIKKPSLKEKRASIEKSIDIILKSGRKIVTMHNLAKDVKSQERPSINHSFP